MTQFGIIAKNRLHKDLNIYLQSCLQNAAWSASQEVALPSTSTTTRLPLHKTKGGKRKLTMPLGESP